MSSKYMKTIAEGSGQYAQGVMRQMGW